MSRTSWLKLGILRRHWLAISLIAFIAITGVALSWTWWRAQSAGIEEPMAKYDLGSLYFNEWKLRPDGRGGLATRGSIFDASSETQQSVISYPLSLVDVSSMTVPAGVNDLLHLPEGTTLRKEWFFNFVVYSPTGHRIAAAFEDHVRIYEAETLVEVTRLPMPSLAIPTATFSWDGNWLAAGDPGHPVFLWNIPERSGPNPLPNSGAEEVAFGANPDE